MALGCASIPIGGEVTGDGQSGAGNIEVTSEPNTSAVIAPHDSTVGPATAQSGERTGVGAVVDQSNTSRNTTNSPWPAVAGMLGLVALLGTIVLLMIRRIGKTLGGKIESNSYLAQKPIYEAKRAKGS